MQFEIVQPIEEHAERIRLWRNDPQALKMSFTYTSAKTLDQFYPEFLQNYFSHPYLNALFALKEGERVGLVRFDPEVEISLLVAPEKRGQGLGVEILNALLPYVDRQGATHLDARIKSENAASIKTFSRAGYKLKEELQGVLLYERRWREEGEGKVFIIAEAGSNWKAGSFEEDCRRAFQMIEAAKAAGADAVKFQTFKSSKTYVPNAGRSEYLSESGIDKEIGELFKELEMPKGFMPLLAEHAASLEIELMSSVFSEEDFFEVDPFVKRHKIASYEISHPDLIRLAAESHKPLILSTGASNPSDIDWAVETFRRHGGKDLTLLQCTACYPAPLHALNLNVLTWLKRRYRVKTGLSDHSLPAISSASAAVALGAGVIEKHFTLDKTLQGPDHAFSLEPKELEEMVVAIRQVEKMQGSIVKRIEPSEEELYQFARRGIQALRNIQAGEILQPGVNIAILRPGKCALGEHPRYLSEVIGKKASRMIGMGEGIKREDLEHDSGDLH